MGMSFSPSRLPSWVIQICVVLFILWAESPGVCQSSGPLWQQLFAPSIASIETGSFSADQLFMFAEQLMREGVPADRMGPVIQELRRAQIQENVMRKSRSRPPSLRIRTIEDKETR
jgi:hypothetical protein